MVETTLPLAPELWATVPAPDQARLVEQLATLRLENAALRAQDAVLQECIRDLEARLGQNSSNSSRPPSSDPPQVPMKRRAPPSGRKRGGQPGDRGVFRPLLPVEQVDEGVSVVLERLLTTVASCRQQRRRLPDCLVAAGEAALQGGPPPSLLQAAQAVAQSRLPKDVLAPELRQRIPSLVVRS